jgi:5'-nucleotidase (lipoprotein e(P4) family)
MKHTAAFCFAILLMIMACKSSRVQSTTIHYTDADSSLMTFAPLWAAIYQQKASEYKALTLQAYNIAYQRLDAATAQPTTKPFAVVTDVDETVLDNSPYNVHQALLRNTYNDTSWTHWTSLADADTVPGALSFFKYAASKNVEVYYITNRSSAEQKSTINNLKKWNFPYADEAHVLTKTTTSSKDARRAQVAADHNVLLWFGDNLGDFEGLFDHQSSEKRDSLVTQQAADFGKRFIVLPNAMYGEWQNALIHYNYKASNKAKADSIIHVLKNY